MSKKRNEPSNDVDADMAMDDSEGTGSSNLKSSRVRSSSQAAPSKYENSDEMGEFEDAWEDDAEEEGEIVIAPDSDDEGEEGDMQMDEENEEQEEDVNVYLPGQELNEDEELVVDQSAYDMLHSLNVEWPCLSFDILRDQLGPSRAMFPHTAYIVAGSQADKPKDNKIYVMKMSQLHRTKHDNDDDEDEDDGDDDLDDDPELDFLAIPHFGGINRIRAMPHTDSHIVSTWAEIGKVHIWDLSAYVSSLDTAGVAQPSTKDCKPIFTVDRHQKLEGYGLDWSPVTPGRLLSGDNNKRIFYTHHSTSSTGTGGFVTDAQPFLGHTSSVEDIQWSPNEESVFISAGADGFIKVWDMRAKREAMLSMRAHDCDVNVISWHRTRQNLLASGCDSGVFSIWDLRSWQSAPTLQTSTSDKPNQDPAATFMWHKSPITSIEWAPHDESMLVVSGADDQITIWDLSLERDAEEEAAVAAQQSAGGGRSELTVPAQLLFIHQGQKDVKEVHWHRQIPGMLVSTSTEGFNVFKTINS